MDHSSGLVFRRPQATLTADLWSIFAPPFSDQEFFARGDFPGWPLRVWPTMKRSFIRLAARGESPAAFERRCIPAAGVAPRSQMPQFAPSLRLVSRAHRHSRCDAGFHHGLLGGKVLAFDVFALFDNFYRVLQRVILHSAPDYKETWNARQKVLSETLPFRYLERLLPNAQVFRSVFYRTKSRTGSIEWHECDGMLIYDGHLLIVEVKAGAFTYTSPATDLSAHITSLQNLVRNPAVQGKRFLDYLESAPNIPIYNDSHNEIGRLSRGDLRHVTVCAVTLDPFTELAARGRHLRKAGVDIGQGAVWLLSIDDLRVYADLFDNPLVFLHFVEQRMRAAQSDLVDVDDELDHLGLYLRENNYSMYAANLVQSERSHLTFDGYRTPIDEYYSAVFRNKEANLPRQEMPARLVEIIGFLGTSSLRGRGAAPVSWTG